MEVKRSHVVVAMLFAALFCVERVGAADGPIDAAQRLSAAATEQEADSVVRQIDGARLEMLQRLSALLRGPSSDAVKARACYLVGEYGDAASFTDVLVDNITVLVVRGEGGKIPLFGAFPCAEALAKVGRAVDDRIVRLIAGTDSACRHVLGAVVLTWAARRADPEAAPHAEEAEAEATLRAAMGGRKGAEVTRLQAALESLTRPKLDWSAPCVRPTKTEAHHEETP